MISIKTVGDTRICSGPQALWDIALDLFGGDDSHHAAFQLIGGLSLDELHTLENVALNVGHLEGVKYACKQLANRAAGKTAHAQLT
jgi:hypothetical protein